MTKRKQPPIECRLRPNYTKKCIACGHGPVVDVYTRDGHFVNSTAMCGACSFGKEKYADPENWTCCHIYTPDRPPQDSISRKASSRTLSCSVSAPE